MSILAVTAPAARRGLTTVAMVKRELGITGSADHDFLEELILQASAVIEGWCRRVFTREDVSETFRLSAERAVLHLARWPNVSVFALGAIVARLDVLDEALLRADRLACFDRPGGQQANSAARVSQAWGSRSQQSSIQAAMASSSSCSNDLLDRRCDFETGHSVS